MKIFSMSLHTLVYFSGIFSFRCVNTGLPSYRELFPSRLHLNPIANESLPSYEDYVKTRVIHPATPNLPLSSPCIWITDQSRRPLCIRGTVTYV